MKCDCTNGVVESLLNAAMGGGLYISCDKCNGTGHITEGPPKPSKIDMLKMKLQKYRRSISIKKLTR